MMNEQGPNANNADDVLNDFKNRIKWPGSNKDDVSVVPTPPKIGWKIFWSAIITIVVGALYYYFELPIFNLHSGTLYVFIVVLVAVFVIAFYLLCQANKIAERREYVRKKSLVPVIIVGVVLVVAIIGWLVGTTFFRASSYSNLMTVESSEFKEDFSEISYDSVPRIDESRAVTLADQQLGSLSEYKSQYVVSSSTTMINYNGNPCRVAYLEYGDIFKWLNNTREGIPAYMIIDLITQKVTVVNCLDEFGACMKYSPTERFNEMLMRHIRFQYPTSIIDTPNFEVSDDGYPYWITPVLNKTIGLFGGTDVKGIIITDALTGDSQYYDIETVKTDDELEWIDVVYSSSLVLEQYNYHGRLSNGFWNSIIFQNDVNVVSSGNGYIAMDDDIWVYTGVTSSQSDTSNFGFILCNQRTKETRYYENGGAIESSAQQSAEDAVQNYGYNATFPILLDIEGQPTYFMSLYGDSNTVKGYALVNLSDKTIVGTGLLDNLKSDAKSLNAAVENYVEAMQDKGIVGQNVDMEEYYVDESGDDADAAAAREAVESDTDEELATAESEEAAETTEAATSSDTGTVSGTISSVKNAVMNGNTYYFLEVDGTYYYISVADCKDVLLAQKGDSVKITVKSSATGDFIEAQDIEIK